MYYYDEDSELNFEIERAMKKFTKQSLEMMILSGV